MNKLKTPFLSILIGSFAGAIASFAFSSPGSNQPPNGNPIFWLLSGTSMYYTAGNVGIGTNSPSQKLEVTGTVYSSKAKSDTALGGEFLGSNGYWGLRTDTSNRFNLDVYNGGSSTSAITVTNSGSVGIGTTSPAASLDIAGTGSIKIPAGTTAQRPSSPASGMIRLNTTTGKIEYYNGSWIGIGSFSATGGTVADVGGYRIHTFTTSGTFTVTNGGNVEALVVGGGGGGGYDVGGGGGAGGLVYVSSLSVIPGSYTITVGAGGAGATSNGGSAPNGGDSIFSSITAKGGGGGGNYSGGSGATGGSGGGASGYSNPGNPGVGTSGQGNSGGYANGSATTAQTGGGGGGAGSVGSNSVQNNGGYTTGGSGLAYSISGSSVMYATGGNGGGDGWGGASSGAANTGNGGDGAGSPNSGSAGGSGIVIIRYPL